MTGGRVTGSLITVERNTGAVYFIKARDRDGRQVKRRLGPVADWPRKPGRGRAARPPDRPWP